MKRSKGLAVIAGIVLFTACVPVKQVQELKDKYAKSNQEREYLEKEKLRLETEVAELSADIERMEREADRLRSRDSDAFEGMKELKAKAESLRQQNEFLQSQLGQMETGSEAENKRLMVELLRNQEKLQLKEDELKLLEMQLVEKEQRLNDLEKELEKREARVRELEDLLAQKDAKVRELKDRVKKALVGFEDKGITVEQRNGRVYVSMEAKLLFSSGSIAVGPEGKTAVIQLAKALEGQEDMTILVEGHTDTDPIKTATIKDNWDLSVMRATEVVRIMKSNSSIDPAILTAAGRGEHFPIASNETPEGKAKNRRIEVILTPNLDKLFQIIEETNAEPAE